jgi:hypothetical protein
MRAAVIGLMVFAGAGLLFSQEAVIREINGTVEVREAGSAVWAPARQGQELSRGALLSTGFKSGALIALGNSTLTVRPLTRVSVEELVRSGGTEKVEVHLRAGRIRADVKPPVEGKTEFTVRSPIATASVRGTSFEFDGVRLKVDEGRVRVHSGDRSGTWVGAGHQVRTDIESGRTASVAETAREALTPALPAGVREVPEVKAEAPADIPPAMEFGFTWK